MTTTDTPAFRWHTRYGICDIHLERMTARDASFMRRQYRWLRQAGADQVTARCALLVAFHCGYRTGLRDGASAERRAAHRPVVRELRGHR